MYYIWYINCIYSCFHCNASIFYFILFLIQGKAEDSTDTGDEGNIGGNKRLSKSFMGSFSKRKVVIYISIIMHTDPY